MKNLYGQPPAPTWADDVEWSITVEQDDIPIDDDSLLDIKEIEHRLENGDPWAWGIVTVTGTLMGLSASDRLSGCSYEDKQDFCRADGEYGYMQKEVLRQLENQLDELKALLSP